jgi:hypothetical protein
MTQGFVPPPYPYDRLDAFKAVAAKHQGGVIDLSVGHQVLQSLPRYPNQTSSAATHHLSASSHCAQQRATGCNDRSTSTSRCPKLPQQLAAKSLL